MRALIATVLAGALLGGCAQLQEWPDGPMERASRSDAKRTVERTCPQGEVAARAGTDGMTQGDWVCHKKKRRKK